MFICTGQQNEKRSAYQASVQSELTVRVWCERGNLRIESSGSSPWMDGKPHRARWPGGGWRGASGDARPPGARDRGATLLAQRPRAAQPAALRFPLLLNPRGEAAAAAARRAGEGEGRGARRGGRGGAGACSGAEPSPSRALTLSVCLLALWEPGLAGAREVAARGAPRAKGAERTGRD